MALHVNPGGEHESTGQATGSEAQVSHNNTQLNDGNGSSATGGDGRGDGASSSSTCKASA